MDRAFVLVLIALIACHKSESEKLCERAAERTEACQADAIDPSVRDAVHNHLMNGVGACARSRLSVAMYRECIDRPSCDELDACMAEFRDRMTPKVDPALPRAAQCEQYARIQARDEALTIVALTADTDAFECLGTDEGATPASCLPEDRRDELARRLTKLAHDCEGWSDESAACAMKLPTGCHD